MILPMMRRELLIWRISTWIMEEGSLDFRDTGSTMATNKRLRENDYKLNRKLMDLSIPVFEDFQ